MTARPAHKRPPEWFHELAEFLRIPSISADPNHEEDVWRGAAWVDAFIREAGGDCTLLTVNDWPVVSGEIRATVSDPAPTILCYAHVDVQPPDPLELWASDPFEPEIRHGRLFGRGTADDKGQLYMLLSAARDLHASRRLPVNIRFLCDGEEESGGQGVLDVLQAHAHDASAAVIFDTAMVSPGRPAFTTATRGQVYLHLTVTTGEHDLHSGNFGGAALNAAHALLETLLAIIPRDGRVADALRAGVEPVPDTQKRAWAGLPGGAEELRRQGAQPSDSNAEAQFYSRTFAEPSIDINGFHAGSPTVQKTVLPVQAVANVSLRVAPGQDPEVIAAAAEQQLRAATPHGAELVIERLTCSPPGLISSESQAIAVAQDAFERATGVRPPLVWQGGTIPIVPALAAIGVPTILTGFSMPDSQIHAPNEHLVVDDIRLGTSAARELFLAFGSLEVKGNSEQ